ncbi:DUF6443 domain-containing protein [Sinomicrobium sp. M5D2P9]
MQKGIYVFIVLLAALQAGAQNYQISGASTVNNGSSHSYLISPDGSNFPTDDITNTTWYIEGGTIQSSDNIIADVTWNGQQYNSSIRAEFRVNGQGPYLAFLQVTVNGAPPSAPPDPTISSTGCEEVVLQRVGTPPGGVTWYWQGKDANGTSTSKGSGAGFTANEGSGTYYIRARAGTTWSTASGSVYVEIPDNAPAIPPVPTITNNCDSTVLTRGIPPDGITWYWQNSAGGTATSNDSGSITRTTGTVYYLRGRHDASGCWGIARTVNYTVSGKETWYADVDNDGFGDPDASVESCDQPPGYVDNAGDLCPDVPGTDNGCPGEEYTPVTLSNENYVYTRTYQKEMSGPDDIAYNRDIIEQVTYYDGLGRPKQEVAIRQSPWGMQDMVTHINYDGFGRREKEYLPFIPVDIHQGAFRTGDVERLTRQYYKSRYSGDFSGMAEPEVNAYTQKKFETSSLNRVEQQAAPGEDWRLGGGHEIGFDYQTNDAGEVRLFKVSFTNGNTELPQLVSGTGDYHSAGQLYKTVTRNENHSGTTKNHTVEEFKDKRGRVVLRRTYNEGTAHDTYYVYDNFGNLTYVLPPKAEAHLAKPNAAGLNELCYQYIYDRRNRLVEKKLPGKGWEYIVYNALDQPVMSRDSILAANNKWLFTKYDAFGRVTYTGTINHQGSRVALQNSANNSSAYDQFETRTPTANTYAGTPVYYSNAAIPKGLNDEIHTIHYYDDYNFDLAGLTVPTEVLGQTVDSRTRTLATGSKVRVLETEHWITTVHAYDSKGRLIYTASKNPYLNTTDIVENRLDFTGKVTETRNTHTKGSNPAIVTIDKFEYDHSGRLKRQLQCIGGDCGGETTGSDLTFNTAVTGTRHEVAGNSIILQPGFHAVATGSVSFSASISLAGELIAENTYDELGQLKEKKVGNTPGNPLQRIAYKYNVRGWLTDINNVDNPSDKLFNFQINYNKSRSGTVPPLFNGNIAETYWKTSNDNTMRRYAYSYDALNRITSGKFNGGGQTDRYTVEGITYDKNGNIETLTRRGHLNSGATSFGVMDNLSYDYDTGNKLLKVTDTGNKTYGFKDGTNTNNDYTYDVNGNLLTDANKGITGISYNHLNLPTQVSFGSNKIAYIYDALGAKLKKEVTQGSSVTRTEYAGNYIYENGQLQFSSHPEGYVTKENNAYTYVYQYKDHLDNVRLSYTNTGTTSAPQLEIIEENNYYPFGLKHRGYNGQTSSLGNSVAQKWKFGGKELEESLGWSTYDFGARNYDPALGRWMNMDPLAEKMRRHSPYNYAFDNPVFWIDPDGMEPMVSNGYTERPLSVFTGVVEIYNFEDVVQDADAEENDCCGPSARFKMHIARAQAAGLRFDLVGEQDPKVVRRINMQIGAIIGSASDSYAAGLGAKPEPWETGLDVASLGAFTKAKFLGKGLFALISRALVKHGDVATKGGKSVLSAGELARIENAATRINKPITVVGSRASGKAGAYSDWDYVIEGLNSKNWSKIKNSLPGSRSILDNTPRNIDIFKGPVNPNLPHITIYPR